jgi:phage-related protein
LLVRIDHVRNDIEGRKPLDVWRIVYRIDTDAVLILDIFSKKTQSTPNDVIENSQRRIKLYARATGGRP